MSLVPLNRNPGNQSVQFFSLPCFLPDSSGGAGAGERLCTQQPPPCLHWQAALSVFAFLSISGHDLP